MHTSIQHLQTRLIVSALALSLFGCASHKTSTVSVTREEVPGSSTTTPTRTITEKTETTTETAESCGGVISCTVEGVGYVLALPFRLMGGLIDVIF